MNPPPNRQQSEAWPTLPYAAGVLALLTAAYALAFVDRQVLTLMVENIKADLHVNDSAMGLLNGFSFSLFYVILGLPLARLMDSGDRRKIVAACIAVWSAMTALCGVAKSFPVLFLARMGVGCGEAGITPGASSLLADCFPRRVLPSAMAIYSMGVYLGQGLALIAGGYLLTYFVALGPRHLPLIGELHPWQMVFLLYGIPGLLLAGLTLGLREPPRQPGLPGHSTDARLSLKEVAAYLFRRRLAYAGIVIGFGLMILVGNGTSSWIPTFFIRKFHWTALEVGSRYGTLVVLCGASGTLCGGLFATFLRGRKIPAGNLVASLVGFVALVPLTIIFPLVPSTWTAFAMIGVMNFFAGFPFGGGLATLQEITPNAMRAQVAALYTLCVNLLGQGLGPLFIGNLTDYLFHDPAHLPEALSITAAIFSPLAVLFLVFGIIGVRRITTSSVSGNRPC